MRKKLIVFLMTMALLTTILTGSVAAQSTEASEMLRSMALDVAHEYVDAEVAYLLGGTTMLIDYLTAAGTDRVPGVDIGVDASALVRNVYRQHQPDMRFYAGSGGPIQRNVNSASLFHYNTRRLTLNEVEPGDLIFFQNEDQRIIGVGIVSDVTNSSVHFITASASAGQVIESHALIGGDYYNSSVAGYGRLTYVL